MAAEMQLLQQAGTCPHCPLSLKSHIQSGGKMTWNLLCHVLCLPKRSLPVGCDSCNPFLSRTPGYSSTNSPPHGVPWGLFSSGKPPGQHTGVLHHRSRWQCSLSPQHPSLLAYFTGYFLSFTDSAQHQEIKNHLLFKEQLLSCSLKRDVLKGYPSHRINCLVYILTIKMSIKSIVLYYEVTQPMPFLFLLCPKDHISGDDKSPRKAITNNLNTELFKTMFNKMNSF